MLSHLSLRTHSVTAVCCHTALCAHTVYVTHTHTHTHNFLCWLRCADRSPSFLQQPGRTMTVASEDSTSIKSKKYLSQLSVQSPYQQSTRKPYYKGFIYTDTRVFCFGNSMQNICIRYGNSPSLISFPNSPIHFSVLFSFLSPFVPPSLLC